MNEETLLDSIKYALRISHTEEGWISPFLDVIRDTGYEDAKWKPSPEVASIWEIAAHALPYTESRLCDFTGDPYPDEEDWPEVHAADPSEWDRVKERAERVMSRLQEVVDGASVEDLAVVQPNRKTPRCERLIDIVVHDAYHAGQIAKLQQVRSTVKTASA